MFFNIIVVCVLRRFLKLIFLKVEGNFEVFVLILDMDGDNSWGIKGRGRNF